MRPFLAVSALAGAITLAALDPATGSWSSRKKISGEAFVAANPTIAVADAALHAVWTDDWWYGSVFYVGSADCGQTWSLPVVIADRSDDDGFSIAASGADVHFVYAAHDLENLGLNSAFYRRSSDHGRSWSPASRNLKSTVIPNCLAACCMSTPRTAHAMTTIGFCSTLF